MEIEEFQKEVEEVVKLLDDKLNVEHNLNNTFIHLIEEVGEIANELNKPNIRNEVLNKEELAEELFDALFFIVRIANLNNINLDEARIRKLKKLKERYDIN
jgi:NTP pyrophosphatase (non-canonical NTP hydrolase)